MITFRQFLKESAVNQYVYHATNHWNAHDIHTDGELRTHPPHYGTDDQDAWPDGSTEDRSYWSTSEHNQSFHPVDGKPVTLRTPVSTGNFRRERHTGDLYLTKPHPSRHLEIKHQGSWIKLSDWANKK